MSLRIRWNIGRGGNAYEIWRATENNALAAELLATVTSNSYHDLTALQGTTYYYFIRSKFRDTTSAFSAAIVGTAGPMWPPPSDVVATLFDIGEILISWSAPVASTPLKYRVYRHTTESFGTATFLAETTALSYTWSGPAADTTYYFWVVAVAATGVEYASAPSFAALGVASIDVPAVPAGLTASDDEIDQVTVAWEAAARASHYELWRATTNDVGAATQIATLGELTYEDTTATPDTTYYYFVRAVNYSGPGGFSGGTAGLALPTLPEVPAGLTATDDLVSQIDLAWEAAARADYYELWRGTVNDSGLATLLNTTTDLTYSDAATPEVTYYYWLKAVNTSGASGFSGGAEGMAVTPLPETPTGVVATDNLVGRIQVAWDAAARADNYELWRSATNDVGTAALVTTVGGLGHEDGPVTPDVPYFYWVRATNGYGSSAFSAVAEGLALEAACGLSLAVFDAGHDKTYALEAPALYTVNFNAFSAADRLQIYNNGSLIADTGYMTGAYFNVFSLAAGTVRIVVEQSDPGSDWELTSACT